MDASNWPSVVLEDNRIFVHKLLRLNFTSYDVRREGDVIHVDTAQCNVMALNENFDSKTWGIEHAYIYAKVLGVYHVNASFVGILPDGTRRFATHRIDLLWVHWYDFVPAKGEFDLDRVTPSPFNSKQSLGFMDPSDALRGVHLIPQFTHGKLQNLRSRHVKTDDLWKSYYINRYVIRVPTLPASNRKHVDLPIVTCSCVTSMECRSDIPT